MVPALSLLCRDKTAHQRRRLALLRAERRLSQTSSTQQQLLAALQQPVALGGHCVRRVEAMQFLFCVVRKLECLTPCTRPMEY